MGIGATFGNSCFGAHSRAQNGTVVNHGSECKHIHEISQFIKDKNHQDPSYCHRNATCSFGKKHNIFVARSSSAIYLIAKEHYNHWNHFRYYNNDILPLDNHLPMLQSFWDSPNLDSGRHACSIAPVAPCWWSLTWTAWAHPKVSTSHQPI